MSESILHPAAVEQAADLGPQESLADLPDRQKAALVWELIKQSDEVHVRVRRDNAALLAFSDDGWREEGERALRHAGRQALGPMSYGSRVLSELKAQARADPSVEVEPSLPDRDLESELEIL